MINGRPNKAIECIHNSSLQQRTGIIKHKIFKDIIEEDVADIITLNLKLEKILSFLSLNITSGGRIFW